MKQSIFKHALLLLLVFSSLASCKKEPIEEPIPSRPPQQAFPNPLPAYARVSKLEWALNDFEIFSYNNQGQVANIHLQWQYVMGDPTQIQALDYAIEYDDEDKPVRIEEYHGFFVEYFYNGQNIEKTVQSDGNGGTLYVETSYFYSNGRLAYELEQVKSLSERPDDVYKHNFTYDGKGNMIKVETLQRDSSGQYIWKETVEYSEFDGKINPISWKLRFPYLAQMRYQFTNPRKVVRKRPNVADEVVTYDYSYDTSERPVLRRSHFPNGNVLEMEYKY